MSDVRRRKRDNEKAQPSPSPLGSPMVAKGLCIGPREREDELEEDAFHNKPQQPEETTPQKNANKDA